MGKTMLLFGGSPCTMWSAAQKSEKRERLPREGPGWELFEAYLKAKEAFRPDFFLYENVASMAVPIRDAITDALGVEPAMINSSLVSAQNRKRLYWTNCKVSQPEDRGIMFSAIVAPDKVLTGKSGAVTASCFKGIGPMHLAKGRGKMAFVGKIGSHKDSLALKLIVPGEAAVKSGVVEWKGRKAKASLPGYDNIQRYRASETDKWAIMASSFSFPLIEHMGDARLIGWDEA